MELWNIMKQLEAFDLGTLELAGKGNGNGNGNGGTVKPTQKIICMVTQVRIKKVANDT